MQRSHGHDAAGRITLQTDTQANGSQQSSTFDYDEAGQLISYAPPSGASQAFTYDPSGNRHSQDAGTYSYVAHTNRLSQAATPGVNLVYQYNADGSPSSDGTLTGRYLESDPIGMKGGVSRFNYAKANPLNNSPD